jgi:hypothetical protein
MLISERTFRSWAEWFEPQFACRKCIALTHPNTGGSCTVWPVCGALPLNAMMVPDIEQRLIF